MKHEDRWTLLERVRKRRDGLQSTEKMQWESEVDSGDGGSQNTYFHTKQMPPALGLGSFGLGKPWIGEALGWGSLGLGKPWTWGAGALG